MNSNKGKEMDKIIDFKLRIKIHDICKLSEEEVIKKVFNFISEPLSNSWMGDHSHIQIETKQSDYNIHFIFPHRIPYQENGETKHLRLEDYKPPIDQAYPFNQ